MNRIPIDRFQGDPAIFVDENGADLIFQSGQPVMDQGFQNQALLSLLVSPGWCGNVLFRTADRQYGSEFESAARGTITLTRLNDIRQIGENSLRSPAFGTVSAVVQNSGPGQLDFVATIQPPGQDIRELRLTKNAVNWKLQAQYPARGQVVNGV
jgi:hypothetical protein